MKSRERWLKTSLANTIAVKGFVDGHPVNQAITRGVSPQAILNTMRNPVAVLSQRGGTRFAYVSNKASVIVNKAGNMMLGSNGGHSESRR